jgi:PAS domain S-box-containing protein
MPALRALILDDSDEDVALLVRVLRKAGYELDYRQVDAPEALTEALAERWQIVISDWSMPRFNGLDAFRIVRAVDPDLPFIIVSGTIGEDVAVEALKAGVHDFMSKGKFARLVPTIERELREAEVRRRQRDADAQLAEQRREVERSERLLREVLEAVPDGVVVTDEHKRLLSWNPAASALLGITAEDFERDTWLERFTVYEADRVTLVAPDQRALARALRGDVIDRELYYIRRAGRAEGTWISLSARGLRDEANMHRTVVVLRDVTGEKMAQEQLLISDRMASVGMLAAGVAHEINNPLAAVIANLEMSIDIMGGSSTRVESRRADLREMLEDARDGSDRVRQIVKDLKIFSRHEDPASGAVDVRRTLESTLRMAWNEIRHRARVIKEYGETPLARGSESRLGQVFLNLIVNAAQAMPEGAADRNTLRVTTRTNAQGSIVIEVSDTGCGMPPETVSRLFTPFFTTKPQGSGTGLGLAISHRIVTGLDGQIEVDSMVGVGTTFRVILLPADDDHARHTTAMIPVTAASRRGRILIIDDDIMVGNVARRVLASQHDVQVSTEATDALELLRAGETFDVIICDLMMPRMTGIELYAAVQAVRPDLIDRIIFLTGGAFTPAARQFLDRVPNERIEKPFDARQLRAMVNQRLE